MAHEPILGRSLVERLIPALRLDLDVYQQVSTDKVAGGQAFMVVLLSGVSNGLSLSGRLGNLGMSAGVAAAMLGWFLWALVILVVARMWGHRRNRRSLLRSLGFADAPGVFLVLGMVPFIGGVLRRVIVMWSLAATVRAVQAVYEVPPRRAIFIALSGFVIYLVIGAISGYFSAMG